MKMPKTRLCDLLGIELPIIQAGMVWVSGARLAAASANAGILGVIGAGSMPPPVLSEQIAKAKGMTRSPIAVNLPLLYERIGEQIDVALQAGIRIFITSAGSPKKWTQLLQEQGAVVLHVAASPTLAKKCEDAGVDAVILEGFEAGGHNGRDELTTFVLLQQCRKLLQIPIVAAGGVGSGHAIAAALALGADGVQVGTLFASCVESSAHEGYKQRMVSAGYNETMLRMRKLVPVRLLDNAFSQRIADLEERCADREELSEALGKGRARRGMHEGDLEEGELEIGQIVSEVKSVVSILDCVETLKSEFNDALKRLNNLIS